MTALAFSSTSTNSLCNHRPADLRDWVTDFVSAIHPNGASTVWKPCNNVWTNSERRSIAELVQDGQIAQVRCTVRKPFGPPGRVLEVVVATAGGKSIGLGYTVMHDDESTLKWLSMNVQYALHLGMVEGKEPRVVSMMRKLRAAEAGASRGSIWPHCIRLESGRFKARVMGPNGVEIDSMPSMAAGMLCESDLAAFCADWQALLERMGKTGPKSELMAA